MKKLLLTLALSLVASRFASAQALVAAVSFDDMKSTCQNPAKFHNQVAPANIQLNGSVTGGTTSGAWITLGSGNFIPNARRLAAKKLLSLHQEGLPLARKSF